MEGHLKLPLTFLLTLSLVFISSNLPVQSQEEPNQQGLVSLIAGSLSQNNLNIHTGDRYITGAISGSLYFFHFRTDDKMIPDLAEGQPSISEDKSTYGERINSIIAIY